MDAKILKFDFAKTIHFETSQNDKLVSEIASVFFYDCLNFDRFIKDLFMTFRKIMIPKIRLKFEFYFQVQESCLTFCFHVF